MLWALGIRVWDILLYIITAHGPVSFSTLHLYRYNTFIMLQISPWTGNVCKNIFPIHQTHFLKDVFPRSLHLTITLETRKVSVRRSGSPISVVISQRQWQKPLNPVWFPQGNCHRQCPAPHESSPEIETPQPHRICSVCHPDRGRALDQTL